MVAFVSVDEDLHKIRLDTEKEHLEKDKFGKAVEDISKELMSDEDELDLQFNKVSLMIHVVDDAHDVVVVFDDCC